MPRNNFSRFATSGGTDRASLGRAVSQYVSTAAGGSRAAAQRMGASCAAGARLLNFLSGATVNGPREALRALNLQSLAGRPIEEVFLGLMDYVCQGQDGGTVDEGIAREAFIETITELAENGITDIDALTADQMQTIFELYAAHAIEARLCNDIGTKSITLPSDPSDAATVQEQLLDFIRGSVSDALTRAQINMQALTPATVLGIVTGVYEQAFSILQTMGDAEAESS
ncbi:MAG TPA: Qat anti-phage system associated protein QatB [Edaphobacter sp.]|uniref:Qat anti-phage system associated protein QatB n=1 Tax=Edaphobacter sp. TaxID=1934404 RepID=UPI002CE3037C|nr:Qat anti-phage system associated protein QatB [Edaphobacter sp.]HUZ93606.1 Qat anti-phage system associated protein QatB [Edaphobacter sp.]